MLNGQLYNVELLFDVADMMEAKDMPLDSLRGAVGPDSFYWEDRNGKKLGPYQIMQDWEAAQKNEAWTDHVHSIKNADMSYPIWVTPDGFVFNGMHRLTKAFINGDKTIKVRVFDELPE